jgi:predicted lipoprotein with Yx(FWY)xxD motif
MTRSRAITLPAAAVVAAVALVALAALALGTFGATAAAAPDATSAQSATVKIAHRNLGKILVDSRGRTLYVLSADSAGKSRALVHVPRTGRRFAPHAGRRSGRG